MVPLSLGRIDVFSFRRSLNHFRSAVSAGECLHNGWDRPQGPVNLAVPAATAGG